jgi:hypothetical protein
MSPPTNSPSNPEGTPQRAKQLSQEMKEIKWLSEHRDEYTAKLLQSIKSHLPELENLLAQVEEHWAMEDLVYRFYHGSFKVYGAQGLTEEICKAMQALLPDRSLNAWFREIVAQGTGKKFEEESNDNWFPQTRAILEALFHAHYFLKMACKYGRELDTPPQPMPSGWAAVLYLYNLR